MCGLVGMVTKNRNGFSNVNCDMFDLMLFVDQMRGQDSTGVFLVNNVGNVTIAKEAVHSTDFIGKKEYREIRQDAVRSGWAMIGHNRKATRGVINDLNAHPFWVEDKLVLVHNGSYFGDHKHVKDTEVDSEAIAQVLADAGGDKIPEALQSINAAYALIWYDIQNKRLQIIRNNQRPLHWMETGDAFFFCSEPDFMEFAAKRCNVTILKEGPYVVEPGNLETWQLNSDRSTGISNVDINITYQAPSVKPVAQSEENFTRASAACFPGMVSDPMREEEITTEIAAIKRESQRISDEALEKAARARAATQEVIEKAQQVETKVKGPFIGPVPDWSAKHSFAEWEQTKDAYGTGSRIRVECKDYLSNEAGLNMVYLTGKTMDERGLYCVFPVSKMIFEAITDPKSPFAAAKRAEFMVDVDCVGWRPVGKKAEKFENNTGLITIIGKRAKMYTDGLNMVQ